ncbi:MAG: hypothetical protein ACUVS2_03395 [Candidatus Flexifilum sp.]
MAESSLRVFTSAGIAAFREWIEAVRQGVTDDLAEEILFDAAYAVPVPDGVTVEDGVFRSRLDAVRYLAEKVNAVRAPDRFFNIGLWSWLSAFYRDSTMPADNGGQRKPGRDYRHILDNDRERRRHLLAYPTQVYAQFGEMPKVIYAGPVHEANQFGEELGARQNFALNPGVLEAATLLYWDVNLDRIKRGAHSARYAPGTLRRFIDVLNQIELTYDLYAMSGEQILRLLPEHEFGRWLTG